MAALFCVPVLDNDREVDVLSWTIASISSISESVTAVGRGNFLSGKLELCVSGIERSNVSTSITSLFIVLEMLRVSITFFRTAS